MMMHWKVRSTLYARLNLNYHSYLSGLLPGLLMIPFGLNGAAFANLGDMPVDFGVD